MKESTFVKRILKIGIDVHNLDYTLGIALF